MRKTALGLCLILTLIFSAAGLIIGESAGNPIAHPEVPILTIQSDYSIHIALQSPPPQDYELINVTFNGKVKVYTLTADVEDYSVEIECSNIVFDGAGHKIHLPYNVGNIPLAISGSNVNVTNLEVTGGYINSITVWGAHCLFTNITTEKSFYINNRVFPTITEKNLLNINTITESNLANLYLFAGSNLISKCNISSLYVTSMSGLNVFTQNTFLCDNSADDLFLVVNSANFWDDGSLGNYWVDYLTRYPNASEIGSTGVGDTPYVLGADNVDRYPIMYSLGAPAVSVSSSENATYFGSFPLNFSLSKPANWVGYSLDGQENVTVTGNSTLTGLSLGMHNVTVYAKDAFGKMGASETLTFTVAEEPFPVVPVAAASVATIAVVGVGLLLYRKRRNR